MQRSSIRSKARSAQSQPQQQAHAPPVHAHTLQAQMDAAAAASASSHSPVPAASTSFSPDRTREFHSMIEAHRHISSSMGQTRDMRYASGSWSSAMSWMAAATG